MKLCRYGHHPEPIIDFEVEVESLESIWADKHIEPLPERFERRLDRALDFRPVVMVRGSIARDRLLALDAQVRAALTAAVGE